MIEVLTVDGNDEAYRIDGVDYAVHPFAALFPLVQGDRFGELLDDVTRHGVLEPVLVWRDQVADGRNRLRAAALAGAKTVPQIRLPDDEDPTERIFRLNYLRRDLNASKRAMILARLRKYRDEVAAASGLPSEASSPASPAPPAAAADETAPVAARATAPAGGPEVETLVPRAAAEAPERIDDSSPAPDTFGGEPAVPRSGSSFDKAVEDSGVSRQMVQKASALQRDAPDLADAVTAGDVTVSDAYAIREQSPAARRRALQAVRDGKARTLVLAVEAAQSRRSAARPAPPRGASSSSDDELPPLPDGGAAGEASPAAAPAAKDAELLAPAIVLAGLRVALGTIDLDVCSTPFAQEKVGARDFFTADQDALGQHWHGSVWAFPPPSAAGAFASKLDAELTAGRVSAAAFLAPGRTGTRWARLLAARRDVVALVLEARKNAYLLPDGERFTPDEAMLLFLFGDVQGDVPRAFRDWGLIYTRQRS